MNIINKYRLLLKQNIHIKELYAGTIDAFVLRIIGYIIAYLFIFFIAKNWGANVTGIFILAILIVNGLVLISTLGLENSVLILVSKYYSKSNKEVIYEIFIKSFLFVICLSIVVSIAIYLFSGMISRIIFNKEVLIEPLKILSFCLLPLSLLKINSQFQRAVKKIKSYVFFNNVVVYLLALIMMIIFYLIDKRETIIYYSFTIACYLSLILSFYPVFSELRDIRRLKIQNRINTQLLFDISIPLSLSGIIMFTKSWLGVFVTGIFLSQELVGTYGITVKIISLFSIIIFSVQSILMPQISVFYKNKDKLLLNDILFNSSRITTVMGIPVILLSIILAKPILNFLGSSFNSGYIPFLILCIGQVFELIFLPANSILQMIGKQKLYLLILILSIAIQVILLISLTIVLGIIGTAIAASLSTIFQTLFLMIYLKKKINININYIPQFFSYLKNI